MAYGSSYAPQEPLDRFRMANPELIIAEVAAARTRARARFRTLFVLTWLILVGGLVMGILSTGRIDGDFLATWGPFILGGIPITIVVSVCAIFFATIFAIFGALGRLSRISPVYSIATLYVSLVRGTPLIVQVFFVYSALPEFGIVLPAFVAGVFALSFNYGAYMTEIFRAGIQAIPRGQREAAQSLGMTERDVMRRIVLPQAIRIVIPAIGNEFIAMIKDSALVSFVGLQELFWRARTVGSGHFQTFGTLMLAALVYWLLTIVFSLVQERLEKRMAEGEVRL